jgi:hypothetical protein
MDGLILLAVVALSSTFNLAGDIPAISLRHLHPIHIPYIISIQRSIITCRGSSPMGDFP